MQLQKKGRYIILLLVSFSAILITNTVKADSFLPGPNTTSYYDWVRYQTETIAEHVPILGKPLYQQFVVKPQDLNGIASATRAVTTSISTAVSVEFSASVGVEATVKDGITKSTAKVDETVSLSADAEITTTYQVTTSIHISNTDNFGAIFSADMYTVYANIKATHYYLHKFVWNWRTGSYYDTGIATEKEPYHKVVFSYDLVGIKHEGYQLGTLVSDYYLDHPPNEVTYYAIKDALDVKSAITNDGKYTSASTYFSNIGNGEYKITLDTQYSYSNGISLSIEASLGEGFEALGNKLMFTMKLSTSTAVEHSEQYSEEDITSFVATGNENQGAAELYTLAWNGLYIKKLWH